MSHIRVVDLEVFYRVGVPEEERASPQRLLVSLDMQFDFAAAGASDRIQDTINYFDVAQEVLKFGGNRNWQLIEKLGADVAEMILAKFRPQAVTVEIKKFPISQAAYVSVTLTRRLMFGDPAA